MNRDVRLLLAREDLADSALQGLVRAERPAAPTPMQVIAPEATLQGARLMRKGWISCSWERGSTYANRGLGPRGAGAAIWCFGNHMSE